MSHWALFLSCCQMTNKDKPLGPNRTVPKELGGRKACPLESRYFFLSLLITARLCRAQSQYSLFQVSQELAALGWQMLSCFRRPLFCIAQKRGRFMFYARSCVWVILQQKIRKPTRMVCVSAYPLPRYFYRKQTYLSHCFDVGSRRQILTCVII